MPASMPAPYDLESPFEEVRVAQAPAVATAAVRRIEFPVHKLPRLMDGVFSHLAEALAEQGLTPIGPAFALHHRFPVDTADLELGLPIDQPLTRSFTLPNGLLVEPSELPAGRVAIRSHMGGYASLAESWGAFVESCGDADEQMAYPFWELYVSNPAEVSRPAELRTDMVSLLQERAATRA